MNCPQGIFLSQLDKQLTQKGEMMKKIVIGLLMSYLPVCFGATTTTTTTTTVKPLMQEQYYKTDAELRGQSNAPASQQRGNVQPQIQTQGQQRVITQSQGQKRVITQPQGQHRTRHVTTRRVITHHQRPVVEEHVYVQQPRRVIVRRIPSNGSVILNEHHADPHYQGAPRVRHYHYVYEEPRVIVRPAPITMSMGYVFH